MGVTVNDEGNTVTVTDQTKEIHVSEVTNEFLIEETKEGVNVTPVVQSLPVVMDSDPIVTIEESTPTYETISDSITIVNQYITGDSEEEMPYDEEVDFVGETVIYRGRAQPNTATSAAAWQIRRITFVGADEDVEIRFAGTGLFDQVWDDRASLTY